MIIAIRKIDPLILFSEEWWLPISPLTDERFYRHWFYGYILRKADAIEVPDLNNGVTAQVCSISAIPQGAKNKLNAYRLLTLLLSEELQGGESSTGNNLRIGLPVNKNALRGKLYGMNQETEDDFAIKPSSIAS